MRRVHRIPGGAGTVTLRRRWTVAHVRWDLAGHADAERISAAFAPILRHLFAVHADRLPRRANLRLGATTGVLRSASPELAELVFELVQAAACQGSPSSSTPGTKSANLRSFTMEDAEELDIVA